MMHDENKDDVDSKDYNDTDNKDNFSTTIDDDMICEECQEDACIFLQHEESLLAFGVAGHASLAPEDMPHNNISQKKDYL